MVWLIAEGELIERFNLNHTEHWIHMCRRNNNRELTQHAQQLKGERQILLVWTFSVIKLSPHADFAANSSWVSGSRLRAHKLMWLSPPLSLSNLLRSSHTKSLIIWIWWVSEKLLKTRKISHVRQSVRKLLCQWFWWRLCHEQILKETNLIRRLCFVTLNKFMTSIRKENNFPRSWSRAVKLRWINLHDANFHWPSICIPATNSLANNWKIEAREKSYQSGKFYWRKGCPWERERRGTVLF